MSNQTNGMAARLRQIDESTRLALVQRQEPAEGADDGQGQPARLVPPVPRKARMFIRHGEGHGTFSDVTLTSPARPAHA